MNTGTFGVAPYDAGVASATLNVGQQLGGSIGTALLNTMAASATTAFLVGKRATSQAVTEATIHGYTVAFWWAAGIFLVGTLLAIVVLRGRPREERAPLRLAEAEATVR